MADLIDRQAAIDALDVLCQEHRYKIPGKRETYSQYNEAWQDALDRAEAAIFNLPSVQPDHNADIGKKVSISCGQENDLISRQAAIEALDEWFKKEVHSQNMSAYEYDSAYAQGEIDAYVTETDTLKTLPAIQTEPHWIPCSERLPEKKGSYLAQALMDGYIFVAKWEDGYWNVKTPIVAWMPLPEPYRGGGVE